MVNKRYLVTGRVQGVGFRYFVYREAQALGVGGWVRNLDDGRVEVLIGAEAAQQAAMEEILRRGPRWSDVETVEVADHPGPLNADGFEILGDGGGPWSG